MKKTFLITITLITSTLLSTAQGTLTFANNSTTLFRLEPEPFPKVIPAGSLRFELFTAPAGSLNSYGFRSTGVFATNVTSAGRLFGGNGIAVPGLPLGGTVAILVRGWSAYLGPDWATAMGNVHGTSGSYVGESEIAPYFLTGGDGGAGPVPASPVFGGAIGIQRGMTLSVWESPEPSALALTSLAFALFWGNRRRQLQRQTTHAHSQPRTTVPNHGR